MARQKDTNMAVDTEAQVNGTDGGAEDDEVKAKRERVDLETLDPLERVQFNITVPAALKLAYLKAGEANGLAGSAYARGILAQAVEYTIPASFDERTRARTYATDEDRKKATAAKAKEQRELLKATLRLMKSGAINADMVKAEMANVEA